MVQILRENVLMRRKKKPDNVPMETAKESVEKVYEMLSEVEDFCKLNGITFVGCVSCWDRLTEQEEKAFKFVGPPSSMIGLLTISGERISDMIYDECEID